MSFDAPSLPPSLLQDCNAGLTPSAEPDKSLGRLIDPGPRSRWLPYHGNNAPAQPLAIPAPSDRAKRIVDIVGASVIGLMVLPVLPFIALTIKATSVGPVIFRQRRLGKAGQLFWCYKFRTMVADAEDQLKLRRDLSTQFQSNYKIKNDPRITRFGQFLRKSSLDELPQLYNVLRGDISLIGPRPIVESERVKYGVLATKLLSVKPGLSGMWQVYGRSDTTYEQRIAMDMNYIESRTLWLDLKLMAVTALVVLRGRGAY